MNTLFTRMRRSTSVVFMIMVLFLTACGGGGSGTSTTSSNVNYQGTITLWHSWQGSYVQAKQAIADAYMKKHPGVKVVLVHQDDVVSKSTTAIRSGNGPDIIAYTDDNLGKIALSNTVQPIDTYISTDFVKSTYTSAAAQGVIFNNHVYGVPEAVETITLMYNKDLISEGQLPKTTNELLAFEQSYRKAHPQSYGVVWNTQDPYSNAPWFYGYGAQYITPDGKAHLDTPQAIQALTYLSSLRPYLPRQQDVNVSSSLFTEGKAAAIIDGPWSYATYTQKAKLHVGFALLPTVSSTNAPAKPFVGVKSLWLAKNAKNPALAADFMKFYTNAANQTAMAQADGEVPANAAAADDPAITKLPAIVGYSAQARQGVTLPNTPYMSAIWAPMQDALTVVWNGSQQPTPALHDAQLAAEKGIQQINP
ncbi:ABC transporter substrate-binding protein [Dictyobacter alpinus]|uniref:ABC transporter substrate-binding protein n=1 Tax=Dictyobacter alpinus TaxID=2014873 RepID=A0A402BEI2_9CHLR|nr:extracellular solute-binding protein [Dictyobacter alpinus]GCE29702.1 ABC transporter substrate-binding protein [Dictyobacter alpinus]